MAAGRTKLSVALVATAAVVVGAVFGVRAIVSAVESHLSTPHCDVGSYTLDTDQASVAAQMVGAASKYTPQLRDRTSVLVLMAGLQESKLTNLAPGSGDRDSVGVLQQRPSQGWGGGSAQRLTDVTEATREFLGALKKVRHWQTLPLADAIQAVQISADGSAYARHEDEARELASALLGRRPAAISCSFDKPSVVASTTTVVAMLRHQLPVNAPVAAAKQVRVPGAGWQTAAWFVANADRLGIDSVSYAGKRWSRADGWHSGPPGRSAVVATLATV